MLKIVTRLLNFVLMINITPCHKVGRLPVHRIVGKVETVIDALHIHRQTLKAVSDLGRNRPTINPAHLLEVGELSHFHPITPNFPAQPPSAQGRRFPIVFNETNVMLVR